MKHLPKALGALVVVVAGTALFFAGWAPTVTPQRIRGDSNGPGTPEGLSLSVRGGENVHRYSDAASDITSPIVGDLVGFVMLHFPDGTRRPLRRRELAELGLDEAGAIARARTNVLAELGPLPAPQTLIPGQPLKLGDERFSAASWLFDIEGWIAFEERVGSPVLVTVPADDLILVAHSADPGATDALELFAARILVMHGSSLVSEQMLRFTNGHFEVMPR